MAEAPSETLSPAQGSSRGTLIPSGFESVAHPVFFRTIDLPPDAGARSRRRRSPETSSTTTTTTTATTTTTTIDPTATAARNIDALESEGDLGADAGPDRGVGKSGSNDERGLREVPSVCPICLEKFEQPVTLTSCLHTFCHTCILGWYEHTVAVALSRGDLSAFSPQSGANLADRINSNNRGETRGSTSTSTNTSRSNKPYRCPLCQIPGPFFLAVERPRYKSKALRGLSKPPELKFKLLGARTVFGGGGEKSGGVAVDDHGGGAGGNDRIGYAGNVAGYPSPGMADLRAAARTQHALAAAAREAKAAARSGEGSRDVTIGKRGEATAGGGEGVMREKLLEVAIGESGEGTRPAEGSKSSGSVSGVSGGGGGGGGGGIGIGGRGRRSGSQAGCADGESAGDSAVARGGGVVGADDETRAAPEDRLEDGSPSPLDQAGWRPLSRRHQGGSHSRPRPGSRHDSALDRRQGRKRRRSEEGGDGGSDFRGVFSAVGGGAPNGFRGASGLVPDRDRSNHGTSRSSSSSSSGTRVDGDYSDGTRSGKKRKKPRHAAREEANSPGCGGGNNSWRRYYIDGDSRNGRGEGVEPGGSTRSDRAADSGGLLWEPGSMPAEDGLEAIEALIAKEKESLRRKIAAGGSSSPLYEGRSCSMF